MDYERKQFSVSRRQLPASLNGAPSIPVRVENGKLLVEATAAGVTGWYSVDTGAGNALTFFAPAVERYNLRNTVNGAPLKVNEPAAVRETLDRLQAALRGPPGSVLVLTLVRTGEETRDVTLTLRDLL
jgi:hypothetical protein